MARDARGRFIPEKYLAGLSPKDRQLRIEELGRKRDRSGSGEQRYAELETDRKARKQGLVKKSAYSRVAERRGIELQYRRGKPDFTATARAAFRYYGVAGSVAKTADHLRKIYNKGLKAWQTGGHRPGASQRNWGDARVHSFLVAGKTAWHPSADRKQARQLPFEMQRAMIAQLPEVVDALDLQGRIADADYLQAKLDQVEGLL